MPAKLLNANFLGTGRHQGAPSVLKPFNSLTPLEASMKGRRSPFSSALGAGYADDGSRLLQGTGVEEEQVGFQRGGDGERIAWGLPVMEQKKVDPNGAFASGGGGGGFSGMGRGGKIDAHVDGDSFAKVNRGHSGPLSGSYTGENGFGGLDEFYANNPKTPTAAIAESMKDLPTMAHGGPVAPLQPFIAGDPQRNGKPNPEIIIPTMEGTHVIPLQDLEKGTKATGTKAQSGGLPALKGLPKFGEGTSSRGNAKRVDGRTVETKGAKVPLSGLSQFYAMNPNTPTAGRREMEKIRSQPGVPALRFPTPLPALKELPRKAYGTAGGGTDDFGRVELLPIGVRAVYDVEGELKGYSHSDGSRVDEAFSKVDGGVTGAAGGGNALPVKGGGAVDAAEMARQQLMNPEGIVVGVTPRAPLTRLPAFRDAGGAQDREGRAYERMERLVLREGRRNPAVAMALLNQRAGGEQAARDAAARMALEQFQQGKLDARTMATIEATNARAEAARKAAADKAIVDWQQKLWAENTEEARRQIASAVRPEAMEVPGTDYVMPVRGATSFSPVRSNAGGGLELKPLPGTDRFYPTVDGRPDLARPFTQTVPGTPAFRFPGLRLPGFGTQLLPAVNVPAQPGQFAPVETKGKSAVSDPVKVRATAYKNALAALNAQIESTTGQTKADLEARRTALLQRQFDEAMRDLDGDGVVSASEAAAAGGGTASMAPVTGAAPVGGAVVSRREQWKTAR
jgi:hypothetical protein